MHLNNLTVFATKLNKIIGMLKMNDSEIKKMLRSSIVSAASSKSTSVGDDKDNAEQELAALVKEVNIGTIASQPLGLVRY